MEPAALGGKRAEQRGIAGLSPVGLDNAISGCVPLNPFGQGNVSQAARDYLVGDKWGTSDVHQNFGELLLTGFAIYTTNMIVFGLIFWEVEDGGPVARLRAHDRHARDFRFPQDDDSSGWRPQFWDYLYVSLTNSIAFSPTDTMPLSLRAKALMGLASFVAAVTVLLVAARAVNVLGS